MNLSGGTAMYIARSFRKRWPVIAVIGLFIIAAVSLFMALNKQSSATVYSEPVKWKQVSAGGMHTCAISQDDRAYCWGINNLGQLGSSEVPSGPSASTAAQTNQPVAVDASGVLAGKRIVKISAGKGHTCAIANDGKAYCWGANISSDGNVIGQLGSNSTDIYSPVPVAVNTSGVLSGKTIIDITAGVSHTCAVANNRKVYCWGSNILGVLGNNSIPVDFTNSNARSLVPVAVGAGTEFNSQSIQAIDAGDNHTCALTTSHRVYCWGFDTQGQLGDAEDSSSLGYSVTPTPIAPSGTIGGKDVTQISAGGGHTCAIDSGGAAHCWGRGDEGQLGIGGQAGMTWPFPVLTSGHLQGKRIVRIVTGDSHTCAIANNNKVYCWGKGADGRLGDNATHNSNVPIAIWQGEIPVGVNVDHLTLGEAHTCVGASNGALYCWGSNQYGQITDTVPTNMAGTPVKARSVDSATPVDQSVSHIYSGSSSIAPGAPLTIAGGTAIVPEVGGDVRMRIGITNHGTSMIPASTIKLRAEYTQKPASTQCNAISSQSWQQITTTSALAYSTSGPAHATAISSHTNDPVLPQSATGYSHQSIVRPTSSDLTFTNNKEITAGQVGLWDLALTDRSLAQGKEYCIRLVTDTQAAPGTSIDTYTSYPVIRAAVGSLDIRFTNTANATITNPTTHFGSTASANTAKNTSAMLSNSTSQQLEVKNTTNVGGWTVALSAAGGSAARWRNGTGTASYAFNGAQAASGRLLVDMSNGSFSAISAGGGQGCDATGLSFSGSVSFVAGTATANAVTIASAAQNSKRQCAFRLQNIRLSQTIPAYQKPDTYTLPMTLTVTAQ